VRFFSKAKVEVAGANFGELVALIQKAQISVNFRRIGDTLMMFETNPRNLPILFDILTKKCYTYRVISLSRSNKGTFLGVVFGVVFAMLMGVILSQFCFGFKVNCADLGLSNKINEYLANQDINFSLWRGIDCDILETQILTDIGDVGLVSVSRRGVFLIVNAVAGTNPGTIADNLSNTAGVFANQEGVVSRIFVSSGTALVNVGDTVSVGQMMVAPYNINTTGEQVPCEVRADVYLYVWASSVVEFCENDVEYIRTGRVVVSKKTVFFDKELSANMPEVSFVEYETEQKSVKLSDILPIREEFIYYYETQSTPIMRDFEAERDALIYEARQKLLNAVDESEILEEKHTINHVGDKYYVNYYAKFEYKVG